MKSGFPTGKQPSNNAVYDRLLEEIFVPDPDYKVDEKELEKSIEKK